MALPPDLPPDRTAIQRVRRMSALKESAAKLDSRFDDLSRALKRKAGCALGSFFVLLSFGSFSAEVALQLLLGAFEFSIWWGVTALIPSLMGIFGVVRCSVGVSLTIGERRQVAIDLRHHEAEIVRLQNVINVPEAARQRG